jgi:hypothetical protein
MKPDPRILDAVAHFNAHHDYSIDAILEFVSAALRHAHMVQLARVKAQDPQLELPIGN